MEKTNPTACCLSHADQAALIKDRGSQTLGCETQNHLLHLGTPLEGPHLAISACPHLSETAYFKCKGCHLPFEELKREIFMKVFITKWYPEVYRKRNMQEL